MRVKVISLLLLVCMLISCNSLTTYSDLYDFDDMRWHRGQSIKFNFMPFDSISSGTITFALRYTPVGVDSSFMMYVVGQANNLQTIDSIPVVLPRGSGDRIRTTTIRFREGVVWQSTKPVELSFHTDKNLDYIYSISIEIENAKKQTNK